MNLTKIIIDGRIKGSGGSAYMGQLRQGQSMFFAGDHGPFYIIPRQDGTALSEGESTHNHEHYLLPESADKAYLTRILREAEKGGWITDTDAENAIKKIITYEEFVKMYEAEGLPFQAQTSNKPITNEASPTQTEAQPASPEQRLTEATGKFEKIVEEMETVKEEEYEPLVDKKRELEARKARLIKENPDGFEFTGTELEGQIKEVDRQKKEVYQKLRQMRKTMRSARGEQEAAESEIAARPAPIQSVRAEPVQESGRSFMHPQAEFKQAKSAESAARQVRPPSQLVNKIKDKPLKNKTKKVISDLWGKRGSPLQKVITAWDSIATKVRNASAELANRINGRIDALRAMLGSKLPEFTPHEKVTLRYQTQDGRIVDEKGWNVVSKNKNGTINLESPDGRTVTTTRKQLAQTNPKGGLKPVRRNREQLPFREVKRKTDVVAIPDTHGDYEAFRWGLRNNGLIDAKGEWIGGNKRVQILGDVFDRGPDSIKILKQIAKYKKEGAQIDLLAGNHEDMILKAMLGQNYSKENPDIKNWLKFSKEDPEQRMAILGQNVPEYVTKHREALEIFRESKLLEQVDDVLYMHGELSDQAAALIEHYGIDGINKRWQMAVGRALDGDPRMLKQVSKDFHPLLWSRATTGSKDNKTKVYGKWSKSGGQLVTAYDYQNIARVLKERGINLFVHGHTPQDTAQKYSVGGVTVINIDVETSRGMRGGDYNSNPVKNGGLTVTKDAMVITDESGQKRRAM